MDRRKNIALRQMIDSVSPLPVDIVIEGETGAGKDTLVQTIHRLSGRTGPLIALNCAAIPESLAESELFGVTSGAFTGAQKSRQGYIEAAHNGTLYLDEVDSTSLALQAKLLRVVENRGIERLGSTEFKAVNTRFIISSKKPLIQLVNENLFRQDLHFRFNTITMQLLPLRARPQDIIPMFKAFTADIAQKLNQTPPNCTIELCQQLLSYTWPGNIRELKGAAERFVLGLPPMPNIDANQIQHKTSLKETLQEMEKALIKEVLNRHNGSIDKATMELNIPKRTLYHRIKTLGINASS